MELREERMSEAVAAVVTIAGFDACLRLAG
jgi:hypothetical protein